MNTKTQIEPESEIAEQAYLGALLTEPDLIKQTTLTENDFFYSRNKTIFRMLLAHKAKPFEILELIDALSSSGELEEVEESYLTGLVLACPSILSVEKYEGIIIDKAVRRIALRKASELARAAYDEENNFTDAAETIGTDIRNLSRTVNETGIVHWSTFVSKLYDEVETRAQNPKEFWGIPTGFIDIDHATGGLQIGELFFLAGLPGIGKSILAHQIALNAAMGIGDENHTKIPVGDFSLEMEGKAIARRLISGMGKINTRHLKSGKLEGDDWEKFITACGLSEDIPLFMSDNPNMTVGRFRREIDRMKREMKIQLVILDYLHLMGLEARPGTPPLQQFEKVDEISGALKIIAREFEIAILAVESVTKTGLDEGMNEPDQSSIKGGASSLHNADTIAILRPHSPGPNEGTRKNQNMRTLFFVKGREIAGKPAIHLVKNNEYPIFFNYAG